MATHVIDEASADELLADTTCVDTTALAVKMQTRKPAPYIPSVKFIQVDRSTRDRATTKSPVAKQWTNSRSTPPIPEEDEECYFSENVGK